MPKLSLLVVLLPCVVVSCGAEPSEPEAAAPEPNDRGETVVEQTPPDETTPEQAPAGETTGQEAPAQAGAEEPDTEGPRFRKGPASSSTPTSPAVGTNGMVSSAHPLATRAGPEVLGDGGNAYDAAVAAAAFLVRRVLRSR